MMYTPTKKEQEERKKELIEFCKDRGNWCLLYNHMLIIKNIRKKVKDDTKRRNN